MIEFEHVLCPVDLSDFSVRSLAHAAALARWYDAELTILHVVPTFDPVHGRGDLGEPVRVLNPISREQVADEVRRVMELPAKAPRAILVVKSGDASTTIVDQAVSAGTDLIVMGTHGRRGFKRLLLGSVTETVLREAPCPVLTVPPAPRASTPETVIFKRILCPIDFSPAALHALPFAMDLARQADGLVTLLHVVEWLPEDDPRTSPLFDLPKFRGYLATLDEYRREIGANVEERLRRVVAHESRTWSDIEDLVTFGRTYREILRVAEEKSADLIVMGAQGRGGVELALFGSTTPQVVRGAGCPVLTVRGLRRM